MRDYFCKNMVYANKNRRIKVQKFYILKFVYKIRDATRA